MVRVKICGITNWSDARAACDLGAHSLGFNFYEHSARVIAPVVAWGILRKLPPFVFSVGIFVNWKSEAVRVFSRSLHLSAAQLHGDETPSDVNDCAEAMPVFKAFRVGHNFSIKQFAPYKAASAFLLDAPASPGSTGQFGGTGKLSDWSVARRAAKSHRIILAGGLNPENVAQAIRSVRPYAVDVTSGVESQPGKKDFGKVREFFREVERANREISHHNE